MLRHRNALRDTDRKLRLRVWTPVICLALSINAFGQQSTATQSTSKEYIHLGGRVIAIENQTLAITPPGTLNATVNVAFSQALTATGGTAPYTWSISGSLPHGLTLSGGTITGTPTTQETQSFTATVTDASGLLTATASVTIVVGNGMVITPGTLPGAVVGSAYSTTLAVTGGTGPYTWTVSTGTLPGGLTLSPSASPSATASIGGTLTNAGLSNFAVRVTDSVARTATANLSINVVTQLVITTSTLPPAFVGYNYLASLAASGGQAPYAWTVAAGSLPAGLTLSPSGTITGLCNGAAGSYPITVHAIDSLQPTGQPATHSYTLVVSPALTITTSPSLPTITKGLTYGQGNPVVTFAATGGTPPYSWSVDSNSALPSGLSLSNSGVLTGTPNVSGTFSFTVAVTDSTLGAGGMPQTLRGFNVFTIAINGTVTITSTSLAPATVGSQYSATLTATGGQAPYTWQMYSGGLPQGLTLSTSGVISGSPLNYTPGTAGYDFAVQVVDAAGNLAGPASLSILLTTPNNYLTVGATYPSEQPGAAPDWIYTSPTQVANWSLGTSNFGGGPLGYYGSGSLSSTTNATGTYYIAPVAVVPDQVATITATAGSLSGAIDVIVPLPNPTASISGTSLTGQPVAVATDQTTTISVTASMGDNWTSSSDYFAIYLLPSSGPSVCSIYYYPAQRSVAIPTSDGNALISGTLGTSGNITNASCSVALTGTYSQNSQGYLATVNLPVTINGSAAGQSATFYVFEGLYQLFSLGTVNFVSGNISMTPANATLSATQTTQFSATVTNQSSSAVDWSVSPALGTISAAGLYTAPVTVSGQQTVTVTATSHVNPALSAWATVTLVQGIPYDLNIPNTTLSSGTTSFLATHNVFANSGFIANGTTGVTFTAGNQIILGPGFHATAGPGSPAMTFHATINPNIH